MTTLSMYSRRTVLAAAASALLPSTRSIAAVPWPTRPVTTMVPFAAGGSTDLIARWAGQVLNQELKQPFIVDNRPGGGGAIAMTMVAAAAPDGHLLALSSLPQMVTVPLIQKVSYDPLALTPISVIATYPMLLGIKSSLPAKTLDEFISYARSVPGKLNYSSSGSGVLSHLAGALFCVRSGIEMVHVPYKGAAPATAALLSGEVDMLFGPSSDLVSHFSSERIRIIATAGEKRFAMFPDIPSINERLPGFVMESWNGYVGPPGMAPDLVQEIAKAMIAVSNNQSVRERMGAQAILPLGSSPSEFAQIIARDRKTYAEAIKAAKMI